MNVSDADFKARAERVFRGANPAAVLAGYVLTWTREPDRFLNPSSGLATTSGSFRVTAPGYGTRTLTCIADAEGWSVR